MSHKLSTNIKFSIYFELQFLDFFLITSAVFWRKKTPVCDSNGKFYCYFSVWKFTTVSNLSEPCVRQNFDVDLARSFLFSDYLDAGCQGLT